MTRSGVSGLRTFTVSSKASRRRHNHARTVGCFHGSEITPVFQNGTVTKMYKSRCNSSRNMVRLHHKRRTPPLRTHREHIMVTSSLVRGGFELRNYDSDAVIRSLTIRPVHGFGVLSVWLPGDTYVGDMPVVAGETNEQMWRRIMEQGGLSMRGSGLRSR